MNKIIVDFNKTLGKINPMHAVNNGPSCKLGQGNTWVATDTRNGNLPEYKAAGIPYARTHDASFYANYGLEHTVDVANIFPNFDLDPNDPENYDFVCTDDYIKKLRRAAQRYFTASVTESSTRLKNTAHFRQRIFTSGRLFVSISSATIQRVGQTATIWILSIGRFGTSLTLTPTTAKTSVPGAARGRSFLSFTILPQLILNHAFPILK